jgi:starvation-inducible outer membrane lipoprotein
VWYMAVGGIVAKVCNEDGRVNLLIIVVRLISESRCPLHKIHGREG